MSDKPIPVSEKLPPAQWYVLFFDSLCGLWTMGFLVELSENRYQWSTSDGEYFHGDNFARITHWMPLPPAPEASDE